MTDPGEAPGGRQLAGQVPSNEEALTDPGAYDALIESLIARIRGKLSTELDEDVQSEMAKLIGLLLEMPPRAVIASRTYFELALDILAADRPNIALARSIRLELAIIQDKMSYGITRYVSYICGSTPLNAAIAALLTTIFLSLVILWVMLTGHRILLQSIAGSELFSSLANGSVALLIIAIHAAFVGGIVSILARIQDFLSRPTISPPLLYISILRKPFLAAAFVVMVYSVLRVGLVSFPGVSFTGPEAPYMAWALGFLCGFSERFAQDFILSAGAKFGETPSLKPDN